MESNELEQEQPAVETPVYIEDDEAAIIAASQAANAKHIAVAEATIEQAVPDSQVSLLQELEDLAEEIGGVRQEQILAISMRMRAVLAAVA